MKTRILVSLVAALFAIGFSGISVSYAAEFEWGDTTALKEHLESHVKYPATGKAIKESCKVEMPDGLPNSNGRTLTPSSRTTRPTKMRERFLRP